MPFSPTDALEAVLPWVVAWGVPMAYLVLCVIMNRVSKRLRPVPPDEIPDTANTPDLHPVLLGALRCHEESELSNEVNAYEVALAAVVRMLGHGAATFTVRGRAAALVSTDDEDEGPIVTGKRRRDRPTLKERLIHSYGAHMRLTVKPPSPSRYDLDALKLVMPPDTTSASVEELCRHARSATEQYRQLGRFLGGYADELCSAGLARRPSPLAYLVFNPLVNILVCLWCLFGPAAALADPDPAFAGVSVGLIIAVMIFRPIFVDLGLRLTPAGCQVLAHASANVSWAATARHGDAPLVRGLTDEQMADLLGVLLSMGRCDLADDLADRIACVTGTGEPNAHEAPMAASFCSRRPYIDTPAMKESLSPVDLLIEQTKDLDRRME